MPLFLPIPRLNNTYNVAVGQNSLLDVTTGNYNTALGSNAGANLVTDSYVVAIGYNALTTNSAHSGSLNTAVGGLSQANATSYYNTSLGYRTLEDLPAIPTRRWVGRL